MLSANEAIKIIGKKIVPDFSIEDGRIESFYEKVFGVFSAGLDENSKKAKGVFLIGSKGVGKSVCMRIIGTLFKDTNRAFRYSKAYEIVKMLDVMKVAEIKDMYGYGCKSDLYIDDIGLGQETSNRYGNTINLISEIIIERYDLFITEGYKTHFSSNRNFNVDRAMYQHAPKTIFEMYGDVVCDRLIEMTEIITWQGQSLRTKQSA